MTRAILTSLLYTFIIHGVPFLITLFMWDFAGIDIVNELMKMV